MSSLELFSFCILYGHQHCLSSTMVRLLGNPVEFRREIVYTEQGGCQRVLPLSRDYGDPPALDLAEFCV